MVTVSQTHCQMNRRHKSLAPTFCPKQTFILCILWLSLERLYNSGFSWLIVFQVSYLSSTTCSEVLSRHRRTWIIDSFTIEEGHPGPFPYVLGKVRKPQSKESSQTLFQQITCFTRKGYIFLFKYHVNQLMNLLIIIRGDNLRHSILSLYHFYPNVDEFLIIITPKSWL